MQMSMHVRIAMDKRRELLPKQKICHHLNHSFHQMVQHFEPAAQLNFWFMGSTDKRSAKQSLVKCPPEF